jgi:type I restriction enzyme S subunit
LKSPIGQKRLLLGGAGVGRPNLNAPTIEAIEIPLPPLAEQNRIISEIERRFSVIDQIEKTIDQSLVQAEKLRQSILKKAFEGKLVPQDPNDEPASVLLERIKQEKGRAESRKKPEKKTKVKVETIMEVSGKTKQAELF